MAEIKPYLLSSGQLPYLCGHSASELQRLEAQGAFFEEITRGLLEAAGLGQGMRVLDIGCGVGDVSLLAAKMVGPSGSVLGIDRAAEPITIAIARATESELRQIEFRQAEIDELETKSPVDALLGRFFLMHQPDPVRTLRNAARHVRRGGLVAFLESQLSALVPGVHSYPHSETYDRINRWMVEVVRAAGAHPDMGLRLHEIFIEAGLPSPNLALQARVEGGSDGPIYPYITESVRSMLPLAERFGIDSASVRNVDALQRQLREEVAKGGGVLTSPIVVGAWCQLR